MVAFRSFAALYSFRSDFVAGRAECLGLRDPATILILASVPRNVIESTEFGKGVDVGGLIRRRYRRSLSTADFSIKTASFAPSWKPSTIIGLASETTPSGLPSTPPRPPTRWACAAAI